MSIRICNWYFDVVSPYAYLQWATRDRLLPHIRLRPVPVVLGALLTHNGQKGPAEIPSKRWHTYRHCQWRAASLGVALRFPPAHPFNPIAALRLIVALDSSEAAVDAVLGGVFRDGEDVSDAATLSRIGASLGIADTAGTIAAPEVKQQLRANSDAAIAAGVFGVPATAIGNELFWGEDTGGMMLDYIQAPGMFETAEMLRLKNLPIGAQRF